jgi:hypothetical protein
MQCGVRENPGRHDNLDYDNDNHLRTTTSAGR